MKLKEFKNARRKFRGTQDKNIVKKILSIIKEFNMKEEMPSTRQISNVYHGVQTVDNAILSTDTESLTTAVQDSILQGILNPLGAKNKLEFAYGSRNQKFWKLPDFVLNKSK